MKILVLGSGAREHAIVLALRSEESAHKIFAAPGNAGIARDARPHLRYQSSPAATGLAARKLVDPSGDSVLGATTAFMLHGQAGVPAG